MVYFLFFISEILLLFFLSKRLTKQIYSKIYKITRRSEFWTKYIFSIIFLPGTFLHEMAHFLSALFMGVRTGEVKFLPEKKDNGLKLGSVAIAKTDPIRRFLIGVAPVFLGISIIVFVMHQMVERELIYDWRWAGLAIYFLFVVGNSMFSSKKDMEGSYAIIVLLLIIYLFLWFFEIRLPIYEFIENLSTTFEAISIFLAAPIIIDLLLIGIFRLADR